MRDGVARQMRPGSAAVIPPADARSRAIECRRLLADGHDHIVHRDAQHGKQAAGRTFSDLMTLYLKGHQGGWRNAKHRQQWRSTLDTHATPVLGDLPVVAIATGDAEGAATNLLTGFARDMQRREPYAAGSIKGTFGKARGHVLRLSIVLEVLWWSMSVRAEPAQTSTNAMRAAIGLMQDYFLPMSERVFGDAAISPKERDAHALAQWIARGRPDRINIRLLSRGRTGDTALPNLRDATDVRDAAEWLQDCGWLVRDAPEKTGGRPRSDCLIASGLWSALDEHACQNRQNRQKSVDVDTERGISGFGGFVSTDTPVDEQGEAPDRTPDSDSDHGAADAKTGADRLLPAIVAPTLPPLFRNGYQPDISADNEVYSLLNRMMAKRPAARNNCGI